MYVLIIAKDRPNVIFLAEARISVYGSPSADAEAEDFYEVVNLNKKQRYDRIR